MSLDIHETIFVTRKAIEGAKGALTRLGRLPPSPVHGQLSAALEKVIRELEAERAALLYAVRHPKAAA